MTKLRCVSALAGIAVLTALLCAGPAEAKRTENLVEFTTSADFLSGTRANLALPVGLAPLSTFGEVRLGGVTPAWSGYAAWNGPGQGAKSYTSPTLADLNGDGLLDLLVGRADGAVYVYQNTGSIAGPVWTRRAAWDPPGQGATMYAVPTVADLNGDGLPDLAIGRNDQATFAYRNSGSLTSPAWTRESLWDPPPLNGTSHAAPAFADLDDDGLVDLIIGANDDRNLAYENTGTTSAPSWTRRPAWDAPSEPSRGWTELAMGDLNGDAKPDLLLGDSRGTISVYRNDGSASGPVWTATPAWDPPQTTSYATPALGNLDDDRDPDLMVGAQRGTLDCVRNNDAGSTAPGTWTSPVLDSDMEGSSWTDVSWQERTRGSGAALQFEMRTAPAPGDLATAAWVPLTQGEQAAPLLGRYAEVRATFTTTVGTSTMVLESLSARAVMGFAPLDAAYYSRWQTTLAWTAPGGVTPTAYDVVRNGTVTGTTTDSTFADFPDRSLLGTWLHYCVLARDGAGRIVAVAHADMRHARYQNR